MKISRVEDSNYIKVFGILDVGGFYFIFRECVKDENFLINSFDSKY